MLINDGVKKGKTDLTYDKCRSLLKFKEKRRSVLFSTVYFKLQRKTERLRARNKEIHSYSIQFTEFK